MANDGIAQVCLVSDFDQTLSKYTVGGQLGHTTFKILELSGLFTPEFQEDMMRLYHTYQPIERDTNISFEEKCKHMDAWWTQTYERYLTLDIQESLLPEMIRRANIQLRHGADVLMRLCRELDVPVTVISAGLGNFISLLLKEGCDFDRAHVISNFLLFDETGKLNGFSEPLIHSLKKSKVLQNQRLRPNIIVLGDMPSDTSVLQSAQCSSSLCIGFVNDPSKVPLPDFLPTYDLLILEDGDLDITTEILRTIAGDRTVADLWLQLGR